MRYFERNATAKPVRRVRESAALTRQIDSLPAFVPAVVTEEAPREASIALELAGGRVLRLPASTSVEKLAELALALEARAAR